MILLLIIIITTTIIIITIFIIIIIIFIIIIIIIIIINSLPPLQFPFVMKLDYLDLLSCVCVCCYSPWPGGSRAKLVIVSHYPSPKTDQGSKRQIQWCVMRLLCLFVCMYVFVCLFVCMYVFVCVCGYKG